MALVEDQPKWPLGRIVREAARLAGPSGEPASTFRDLNARNPVVQAFGNHVVEHFTSRADRDRQAPTRARREIGRGHDWGEAFAVAEHNMREGIEDWRTCAHPAPRVSTKGDLGFCRACSSWRGSTGAWMPPLGHDDE